MKHGRGCGSFACLPMIVDPDIVSFIKCNLQDIDAEQQQGDRARKQLQAGCSPAYWSCQGRLDPNRGDIAQQQC
eukprot:CAMPEP_0194055612 /NCGR_PEP_ID=MMETSP0009_2-20130614/57308_1 /TAXON_ID=210454 /ORGANISM="Grammatophora oceanica, Strain CCMP 410" /LENGTH=73 /DNA_ID=CAMNT_0038704581 /DNA_START=144 /DNA_END=362 /DNA_ORIENTATION=-